MSTPQRQKFVIQPEVTINAIITKSHTPTGFASPSLVFLHYWGGSANTWADVNTILSQEYDTVAIDFRGWGDSTGPSVENAYAIANHAADVKYVIRSLKLTHFVLIGLSMGAKVAQLIAGDTSFQGLQAIVLVSPAPPSPLNLDDEMREQQIHAYDTEQTAIIVAKSVLTASSPSEMIVAGLVTDMLKGNPFAKSAWPSYAMREDISDAAKRIKVRTLIVAAELDQIEPIERVRSMVQGAIADAELVVLPASGHLSPIDKPKEVAEAIKTIL